MPWFVRNLLQASSPLRLYGWRGVRGVGRARRKDTEAAEFWQQLGGDELLSTDPQFLRLNSEEGVSRVKASKDHNIQHHHQPIPVMNQEERGKTKLTKSGKEFQERKDLTFRQFIRNLKMELNPQVVTKENQFSKVQSAATF